MIWQELGAETLGELLYACNENRLIALKGFGHKTQIDLKKKIEYYLQSKDKFHYATLESDGLVLIDLLKKKLPNAQVELTGAIRRRCTILNRIEIIVGFDEPIDKVFDKKNIQLVEQKENMYAIKTAHDFPATIYQYSVNEFGSKQFLHTGSRAFLEGLVAAKPDIDFTDLATEIEVFEKAGLPFIEPELREDAAIIEATQSNQLPTLLEESDIKGVIHSHTTYSDGLHTLREMAEYSKAQGYEYIVITDHSKSAFYANGLKPDRVAEQMTEIDTLNQELAPFKIYKGIESDILGDGSLDYDGQHEKILAQCTSTSNL